MAAPRLSRGAVREIDRRVEEMFARLKSRLMGGSFTGKHLLVAVPSSDLSLPGVFGLATSTEGGYVDKDLLSSIAEVTLDYLDKQQAEAKASTKRRIQATLDEMYAGRIQPEHFRNHVESELTDLWGRITGNVSRVVETEVQTAGTMGIKSAIEQVNVTRGIEDPVVVFLVKNDQWLCDECRRVHLLPNEVTPRAWLHSEVSGGYHERGEDRPSWHLLHPNCRCLWDGNAPVITESGIRSLKKVVAGDYVLTHTGKFRKVLATFGKDGKRAPDEKLYRIEFRSPDGKLRKLRVTDDHLMLTAQGWLRADVLKPGDSLQYLYKACEQCGEFFPYDIQHPDHRFCSIKCVGNSRVGKMGPRIGQIQSWAERAKRRESVIKVFAVKRQGRIAPQTLVCEACNGGFTFKPGYVASGGRWVYRQKARFCSRTCASHSIAMNQWKNPEHRKTVSAKNRASMKEQYRSGRRDRGGIAKAREALLALGGGASRDQCALFSIVKDVYPDAVLDTYKIGPYFPDIAIPSMKTVVEWDGEGHWLAVIKGETTMEEKLAYDLRRDEYMHKRGWHVLRYSPETGSGSVLEDIRRVTLNSTGGYVFRPVTVERVAVVLAVKKSKFACLYDITVEGDESFVVMGVVSHNCSLATLLPGFGFDAAGRVTYIKDGFSEREYQLATGGAGGVEDRRRWV